MTAHSGLRVGNDPSLLQYLSEIGSLRTLSREEEAALAERIACGDDRARQELVQANTKFVVSVARNYQHRGLSLADLISAGNMGLMTAVERFDGARGYKFISYAVWWIRQAIQQALAEDSRTVRISVSMRRLLGEVINTAQEIQDRGGSCSADAIAGELGISLQEVTEAMLSNQRICSLNGRMAGRDEDFALEHMLADDSPLPDERVAEESSIRALRDIVGQLPDGRERKILVWYYALDMGESLTLDQIGTRLRVTPERVRQLKEFGLRRLRCLGAHRAFGAEPTQVEPPDASCEACPSDEPPAPHPPPAILKPKSTRVPVKRARPKKRVRAKRGDTWGDLLLNSEFKSFGYASPEEFLADVDAHNGRVGCMLIARKGRGVGPRTIHQAAAFAKAHDHKVVVGKRLKWARRCEARRERNAKRPVPPKLLK